MPRLRRYHLLLLLLLVGHSWTQGCARHERADPVAVKPFPRKLLASEFALCDSADAFRTRVGRWPRTTDELRAGATWAGLDIEAPAFARTILHETPDGRLTLEFRGEGGSIYATKLPPASQPSSQRIDDGSP